MFLFFESFQPQNILTVLLFSIKQTTPDVKNCEYFIKVWINFINGWFIRNIVIKNILGSINKKGGMWVHGPSH